MSWEECGCSGGRSGDVIGDDEFMLTAPNECGVRECGVAGDTPADIDVGGPMVRRCWRGGGGVLWSSGDDSDVEEDGSDEEAERDSDDMDGSGRRDELSQWPDGGGEPASLPAP